jgi:hypothetical protein
LLLPASVGCHHLSQGCTSSLEQRGHQVAVGSLTSIEKHLLRHHGPECLPLCRLQSQPIQVSHVLLTGQGLQVGSGCISALGSGLRSLRHTLKGWRNHGAHPKPFGHGLRNSALCALGPGLLSGLAQSLRLLLGPDVATGATACQQTNVAYEPAWFAVQWIMHL